MNQGTSEQLMLQVCHIPENLMKYPLGIFVRALEFSQTWFAKSLFRVRVVEHLKAK